MVGSVLCVGLVCVDIVSVCAEYPEEDTDRRAKSLHWQRGGNAASTSIVLSNLGTEVEFFGTVPKIDTTSSAWGLTAARFALEDLKNHGVHVGNVQLCDCEDFPTSTIIVNSSNGSRTIIHHRGNLRELTKEEFFRLDMTKYKWIHFEGRPNVQVIEAALEHLEEFNKTNPKNKIMTSIELEKPHVNGLLELSSKTDLVFVSKEFAMHHGHNSALEAAAAFGTRLKECAEIVCTWGSVGAAFSVNDGTGSANLVEAVPPAKIVDTVGAGDAFIAGVIHSRSRGSSLARSVQFGCRVSESKITDFGFDHVTGTE